MRKKDNAETQRCTEDRGAGNAEGEGGDELLHGELVRLGAKEKRKRDSHDWLSHTRMRRFTSWRRLFLRLRLLRRRRRTFS
jgi:hypothetical protein